ncbi:Bcr/CflA family multidrug efflux MFS transporter [Pseudomonas sp. URMO17WK12:I4]|uniref:Bcr/CflA family multidrug efflux MFS transporter n=1 Tax=Pseudomonas sp. URMO17WK12:I4 TaxID=1283292 RepID=UPI000487D480|nr:Bcr/CflA family multidrug efflux MFS transporter [Pseudomonas sp. URMO17WK12:I4]
MPVNINARCLIVLLAALTAFGPLSIDLYLPSLPLIASDLQANQASVQLSISVFLAGLCLGMLLYGPLSDRFGRRPLLLFGISLYVVASLGCALADRVEALLLWRFLQALGGAAASVLARAVVRDLFPVTAAARVFSLMHLVTMLATLVAPLAGSYLMLLAGWRSLFLLLLAFASSCLALVTFNLPESHPPEQRGTSLIQVFRAYGQILCAPAAVGFILCMGLSFAGMFAFITASPFVYIEYFGVSSQQYGGLFALNIAGVIVATVFNARVVSRFGANQMLEVGTAVAALAGISLAVVGGLGLGGLPAIVICILFYISMTGLIGANCLASLLEHFPQQAGAAAGLAVSMQFGLGMVFSALAGALHDGTAASMSLLMGMAGAGCCIAFRLANRLFKRGGGP